MVCGGRLLALVLVPGAGAGAVSWLVLVPGAGCGCWWWPAGAGAVIWLCTWWRQVAGALTVKGNNPPLAAVKGDSYLQQEPHSYPYLGNNNNI